MTAISPCSLATNITATAFIVKHITHKRAVLLSGLLYALGRASVYTVIGLVLFLGASQFQLAKFLNSNGERFLSPLLIVMGLIMLNVIKIRWFVSSNLQTKLSDRFATKGFLGAFCIGIIFALAFCPYSGALYFGMLIPMSIASIDGLFLPFIFAIGTSLPVLLFTYILAFAAEKITFFYKKLTQIEKWMRIIVGVIFVIVGIYYAVVFLVGI